MSFAHPSVAEVYEVGNRHVDHVHGAIDATNPSVSIVPLLINADVLPHSFLGARLLPAVYYGADPIKMHPGIVDIMPAAPTVLDRQLGQSYFNPHGATKSAAFKELKSKRGGDEFVYSSYLLESRGITHMFTDVPDEESPRLHPEVLTKLALAYGLGSISVGNQVLIGEFHGRLPKPGFPAIIREIGQTILGLDYSLKLKAAVVKEVIKELEANRSPDYRNFRRSRSRQK